MRAAAACAVALMLTADAPRFDIAKTDVLVDDGVAIAASGFAPGASITVTLRGGADDQLTSSATFVADANGAIDLGKMAPTRGSYKATAAGRRRRRIVARILDADGGSRRRATGACDAAPPRSRRRRAHFTGTRERARGDVL